VKTSDVTTARRPPRRWRRGLGTTFVAALFTTTAALTSLTALPSGAVGDAALSQHIISDPIPGWTPLPQSQLAGLASALKKAENSSISKYGGRATTATDGWTPSTTRSGLIVSLIAFVFNGLSGAQVTQQGHIAAQSGAISFCKGATGTTPRSNGSVSSIPGSHIVICASVKGVVPEAVTFTRANVLTIVESTRSALSSAKLAAIARKQYLVLPTTTSAVAGG
jgi:hypothetical protein